MDVVRATILWYTVTDSKLQLALSETIRVGKAYERVRILLTRSTRAPEKNLSRMKNITPFPGHMDNPMTLTTTPVPVHDHTHTKNATWPPTYCHTDKEDCSHQPPPKDIPIILVFWRCCATPDDIKRGLVIAHNSLEKMLEHCSLSSEFKKAFPKKHEQFMAEHNLTLADQELAQRHQKRITKFKQVMTGCSDVMNTSRLIKSVSPSTNQYENKNAILFKTPDQ